MKKIVQRENKILRKISKDVPIKDIGSKKINSLIDDMRLSLENEHDGVALAAPQIGVSLRIFIVTKEINTITNDSKKIDLVFINPRIVKKSKGLSKLEEGCLSVRFLYGKVLRSNKTTVEAYDQFGKKFERGASGLLSQIFQHEIDHLDGILFSDKASEVEDLPHSK